MSRTIHDAATQRREPAADHDHAREAEPDGKEDVREQRDERRRLEMEAPADLLTAGAQAEQRAADYAERKQHARGVRDAMPPSSSLSTSRVGDEREDFHGQHRQHTRHEVEHEPAEQREPGRTDDVAPRDLGGQH